MKIPATLSKGRSIVAIPALGALLIAMVWIATFALVRSDFEFEVQNEYRNNANLARALGEHTSRTLRSVDQTVLLVKYLYEQDGRATDVTPLVRSRVAGRTSELLNSVGVVDAHGDLVLATTDFKPVNVADLPYFKAHVAQDMQHLFIGAPKVGVLTGQPAIIVTRRINGADGSFAGVAYAAVNPDHFWGVYRQVDLGPSGVVSVIGRDGIVRARQSSNGPAVGTRVDTSEIFMRWAQSDTGNLLTGGASDGIPRFVSYRTVDDYALMVAVGTAESEVLAAHFERARRAYWVAGVTTAALLLLVPWLALSRLRRSREALKRRRTELDLLDSETRRASIVESAMDAIVTVDAEHNIVIFNRSAEQVFRCPASEALGRSLDRFLPAPVWAASVGGALEQATVVSDSAPALRPMTAMRGDGEEFPIEASISQSTSRDRVFYTLIARDITERNEQDSMLRRFRTAMDAASDGIFLIDRASMRFVDVNDSACRMLGYPREQLLLLGPSAMMTPARAAYGGNGGVGDLERSFDAVIASDPGIASVETGLRHKDGTQIPVELRRFAMRSGEGWTIVGVARDISARLRSERAIETIAMQQGLLAAFGQQALENTDLDEVLKRAVVVAGEGLTVGFCKLLQVAPDGTSLIHKAGIGWGDDWISGRSADASSRTLNRLVLEARGPVVIVDFHEETRFERSETLRTHGIRSCVQVRIDGIDGPFGLLGVYSRNKREFSAKNIHFLANIANIVTAAIHRKSFEAKLSYLAHFDSLTGLPNRVLFLDRLAQALTQAKLNEWKVGAVIVDLDDFKLINDAYGRATGDALLGLVASRLREVVRAGDSLGHLGGDEFGVVLSQLASDDDANVAAHDISAALSRPFEVDGKVIHLSASLGVSLYPPDPGDPDGVLRNADVALFRAKEHGGNGVQFYTEALNTRLTQRMAMTQDLRGALDRQELELHYQPQVSLDTGRVIGVEALARWRHPQRGLVLPLEFVPLAEEAGLIVSIGDWVLRTACAQAVAWHLAGRRLFVSVNVSSIQLQQANFADSVRAALESSGLDAHSLELELTESVIMGTVGSSVAALADLRSQGVSIAIDDFGTGYSSLSYLKRLPIDTIKIDKAFIRDLIGDPGDAAIVRAVIDLAHHMKLRVVAEGVETEEQANFLRRSKCDVVQGYLFGAAVPEARLLELLDTFGAAPPLVAPADSTPSLLLVDDEENNLKALRRVFRREGYQIHTATSAHEAFKILANVPVGVIVSDQRMPDISGTEFLTRVKALYPDTIRIVLSGYTDLATVTGVINEGAIYKFLTKPWNDESLRRDIRQAFRLFAEREEVT